MQQKALLGKQMAVPNCLFLDFKRWYLLPWSKSTLDTFLSWPPSLQLFHFLPLYDPFSFNNLSWLLILENLWKCWLRMLVNSFCYYFPSREKHLWDFLLQIAQYFDKPWHFASANRAYWAFPENQQELSTSMKGMPGKRIYPSSISWHF